MEEETQYARHKEEKRERIAQELGQQNPRYLGKYLTLYIARIRVEWNMSALGSKFMAK